MVATFLFPPMVLRATSLVLTMTRKLLMASGLILVVELLGLSHGHSIVGGRPNPALPSASRPFVSATSASGAFPVAETLRETTLSPRMRGALAYVARRYRVSVDALQPIFATAQAAGHEHSIDPLLIVAVIGIESGFNPFSQSLVGAQGLMQVLPHYHRDKLPSNAGELSFFDPHINVQVGALVLKESIRRNGGLEDGLQQFGGAANDPERRYSSRVLAEQQRLEQAAQRQRAT